MLPLRTVSVAPPISRGTVSAATSTTAHTTSALLAIVHVSRDRRCATELPLRVSGRAERWADPRRGAAHLSCFQLVSSDLDVLSEVEADVERRAVALRDRKSTRLTS